MILTTVNQQIEIPVTIIIIIISNRAQSTTHNTWKNYMFCYHFVRYGNSTTAVNFLLFQAGEVNEMQYVQH